MRVVLLATSLSFAVPAMFAGQATPPTDATSALTCIQNALGGTASFAAVTSLYIKAETKPSQNSGMRPVPGTQEMSLVFPDQYRRTNVGKPFKPGESALSSAIGFNKGMVLSEPPHPDPKRGGVVARQDFERQMLMRLPRKSATVKLSQRVTIDSGLERLAIDASGTEGFKSTLLVDRSTCMPIALLHNTVTPTQSGLARVELSGYRLFGGIRFPTMLKTLVSGEPYREERVTSVEVNTPTAAKAFAGR